MTTREYGKVKCGRNGVDIILDGQDLFISEPIIRHLIEKTKAIGGDLYFVPGEISKVIIEYRPPVNKAGVLIKC